MDIVLRATVVVVFILVLVRVMGRRELSKMKPFDLIVLIVIGDVRCSPWARSASSQSSCRGSHSASLAFARCWTGGRSCSSRRGSPIADNLRRERITLDELSAQARLSGIASLENVQWAVLETGGQISFIRR